MFYLTNPNLLSEAVAFIHDFKLVQISQNFWWLEPSTNHPVLYSAAAQFCYVFALVHVAILIFGATIVLLGISIVIRSTIILFAFRHQS